MSNKLFLATSDGLAIAECVEGEWQIIKRVLNEQHVTSVIAREGVILVGSRGGVRRSDDLGERWQDASEGLTTKYVRWLAYHPDISDCEFAGTEPADIFVSRDGGGTWKQAKGVAALRDKHKWMLPYSPEAGCIRGFAFHGARVYAAAEVGGALRSDDEGQTWTLCEGSDGNPDLEGPPPPFIYPDVHSIEVHPSNADWVYAPTGGGFYISQDGGANWTYAYECYVRAMWLDPEDPLHMLLGPADNVDRNGRIEESRDGGATWQPASGGLKVPWRNHMVERFKQVDDEVFAVLSNGQVLVSPLNDWNWTRAFPEIKNAHAVWAM